MKTDEFFYENEAEGLKADIEKAKSMTEAEMHLTSIQTTARKIS